VDLCDVIVDGGESAKSLNRPGMAKLLDMVEAGQVKAVIIAKLDRLTRSVKDLCGLLELFEKRKVSLISVAESLDTGSAAGRLVITIMAAVSQWEREAIGERTRDALRHKRAQGRRVGNIEFGLRLAADGETLEPDASEQRAVEEIRRLRGEGISLRGIAATLNHQPVTRKTRPYSQKPVETMKGASPGMGSYVRYCYWRLRARASAWSRCWRSLAWWRTTDPVGEIL
jgi:DNA invertase Pin-like site-specific DNA recombinase